MTDAGSIRVLFVDDDPDDLNAIDAVFSGRNVTVIKASSAEEAFSFFDSNRIDIIFSINLMQGMSGIQLLERVKEQYPDTIRILMTPKADMYLELQLDVINRCELFHIITKPWKEESLQKSVDDAIKRLQITAVLKNAEEPALHDIAQSIEQKDAYTEGHCERISRYALLLADALELPEEMKREIKIGSWLHDCGKIDLPASLLNFEGQLDENQFKIVEMHPLWGADIALQAGLSETVINIIRFHHERFDGSGYPEGIKGNEIPIEARIVGMAETYDIMTSRRPYKEAVSYKEAVDRLTGMRGNKFDPELLDIFLQVLEKERTST